MARRFGISCGLIDPDPEYHHHDDRDLTDEWQKEVYEHAANLAHSHDHKNIRCRLRIRFQVDSIL